MIYFQQNFECYISEVAKILMEARVSACVPIDRKLVSSHQELLIIISTLLSNNETSNRCKITKGENAEQTTPIPKDFLKLFFSLHVARKRCLSSKFYFPVFLFQHSLKKKKE